MLWQNGHNACWNAIGGIDTGKNVDASDTTKVDSEAEEGKKKRHFWSVLHFQYRTEQESGGRCTQAFERNLCTTKEISYVGKHCTLPLLPTVRKVSAVHTDEQDGRRAEKCLPLWNCERAYSFAGQHVLYDAVQCNNPKCSVCVKGQSGSQMAFLNHAGGVWRARPPGRPQPCSTLCCSPNRIHYICLMEGWVTLHASAEFNCYVLFFLQVSAGERVRVSISVCLCVGVCECVCERECAISSRSQHLVWLVTWRHLRHNEWAGTVAAGGRSTTQSDPGTTIQYCV